MSQSQDLQRPSSSMFQLASSQLREGETLLAWFEHDLDARLHYTQGHVVLTSRRILSFEGNPALANGDGWQSYPLGPDVVMQAGDQGGLGVLELLGPQGRLAAWHYTAAHAQKANQFAREAGSASRMTGEEALLALSPATPQQTPPEARVASLFRLFRFTRAHLQLIVIGFLLALASNALALVPPYLTMPLLDRVLIPHQTGQPADFTLAYWLLGGLLVAALFAWVLDWARLYVMARVSEHVSCDLRSSTNAHLQRLSVDFFGGRRTGDLISRVSSDTDRLCNFLSLNLVDFFNDVLMIIMTAIILLAIDWTLALAALFPFPLIAWLVFRVRGRFLHRYQQSASAWGAMTSVLADTIPGIRVVKAFAQEQREIDRFDNANQHVFRVNDMLNRIWAAFGPTVSLLTTLGLLVVWAFACYRIFQHGITVGVLTAFLVYINRFYGRVESIIRMTSVTQRAAASAQRIFEILDQQPSVPEPAEPVHPGRVRGEIELRDVRFRYGAREVLHGISLHVRPGEMIGLVGPSGAGKSTMINLMSRFYDVSGGSIRVDGEDIRSFPVEEYRCNIGMVLQDPFMFYGTVAENIAYGKPNATREEIIAVARAARAHEFILSLPDGYDSMVGERGQSLSGGERQRLSIARALLIDPRILILDEATSSVDTETELEIQAALETVIKGRTTIAIAHRLSTLRRADRLVVIDQGRVVEEGKHDTLVAAGGVYARLFQAQVDSWKGHAI